MSFNFNKITNPQFSDGRLYGQNIAEIREKCKESGTVFTDPKFRTSKFSISYTGKVIPGSPQEGNFDINKVTWVRAKEFYPSGEFIIDGFSKDDINQGCL